MSAEATVAAEDFFAIYGRACAWPRRTKQGPVRMITPDDLKAAGLGEPVGGDGKAIPWSRISSGTLLQEGSSRYTVSLGDPDKRTGIVLEGATKKPFVLDFDKLAPILRARRPDLFAGGK